MSDGEVSGGPSGIRTQDRRIKSQRLQLQNSRKMQEKRRSQAAYPGILDTNGDNGDT